MEQFINKSFNKHNQCTNVREKQQHIFIPRSITTCLGGGGGGGGGGKVYNRIYGTFHIFLTIFF